MKVKTVGRFYDLKEDIYRDLGDEFEVTQTRAKELGDFVEFVEDKKKASPKETD